MKMLWFVNAAVAFLCTVQGVYIAPTPSQSFVQQISPSLYQFRSYDQFANLLNAAPAQPQAQRLPVNGFG